MAIVKCSCGLALQQFDYASHVNVIEEAELSPTSNSSSTRCPHCRKDIAHWQFREHLVAHDLQERLDSALQEAQRNKRGITVDGLTAVDFGLESELSPPSVFLAEFRLLSSNRNDEYGDRFSAQFFGSRRINPGRPRTLRVFFQPSYPGRYEDTLELVFWDRTERVRFVIHRRLLATVGDRNDHAQLQASAPYTRRKRIPLRIDGPIRRSLRPPSWTKTKWIAMLPKFDMPRKITDTLYKRDAKSRKETLAQDLDAYAMDEVLLKPSHPRYNLQVEGLAEGRPSVLVGDFILVRQTQATDKTWFQGRVHQVFESYVSLRFDDTFSTYRGNSFDIRFVLNRLSFRRMHAAITNTNNPTRLLFPGLEHVRNMQRVTHALMNDIVPINRQIGEDPEQLECVAAIVNLPPGSPPFVVFGPPGTGKTVTIVEAMRQLLAHSETTRILVCAPSNSAADLIAQRLSVLGTSVVLRLNSITRKLADLPKSLRAFSIINGNEIFAMPSVQDLRKYRVVVSTCITAGVPASLGIERGFYSHIFVDEAGQAMEPTVMTPLKTLADDKTNVIVAGDNKQLGPIVHSALASALGLKTSYLARIMDRDVYSLKDNAAAGGRGVTIIKLVRNFRSHPAILGFSNEHFYNRELQYCGPKALIRSLETSDELPTKRFPLIFHSIVGKDQREAASPSFFNIEEATLVKKYCNSLVSDKKNGIRAEHIAVITPYHAQRIKILNLLYRDPKTRDIKVGSVEEFPRTSERRIVIISTVRSSTDFITADITRMLGFVASPHRFNVAVTRAQALLIVVGNPTVLSLDPLWRGFLNYVHRAGLVNPMGGEKHRYDAQMRHQAAVEAEDTLARLKALITRKNEEIEDDFQFELDDDSEEEGFGLGEGAVFREED
ncbi:RNA helicase [Gymnopus androsaceus JB14]|uniref:RNA helicase n=1 Tax=Gymnopus androsaceus JB14 TaxID=1447944 RepID=A0A6A4H2Z9_9AGAR|nr:RNA helicase [Gymnopus androsaceus JB14]